MAGSADLPDLQALLPESVRDTVSNSDGAGSASFADIGLTSMQLIQFVSAVEVAFDVEFSPEEFLRLPQASLVETAELVAGKVSGHA